MYMGIKYNVYFMNCDSVDCSAAACMLLQRGGTKHGFWPKTKQARFIIINEQHTHRHTYSSVLQVLIIQ